MNFRLKILLFSVLFSIILSSIFTYFSYQKNNYKFYTIDINQVEKKLFKSFNLSDDHPINEKFVFNNYQFSNELIIQLLDKDKENEYTNKFKGALEDNKLTLKGNSIFIFRSSQSVETLRTIFLELLTIYTYDFFLKKISSNILAEREYIKQKINYYYQYEDKIVFNDPKSTSYILDLERELLSINSLIKKIDSLFLFNEKEIDIEFIFILNKSFDLNILIKFILVFLLTFIGLLIIFFKKIFK